MTDSTADPRPAQGQSTEADQAVSQAQAELNPQPDPSAQLAPDQLAPAQVIPAQGAPRQAESNVRPLAARNDPAVARPGPRPARPGAKPAPADSNVRPLPGGQPARPRPQPVPRALPTTVAARARPRHHVLIASFLLLVLLPFFTTVYYLWGRAAPEYHSETAFSVRSEGAGGAAAGILGALTQIGGGGSASDVNVIYDFIRSQEIVERINAKLDLRAIWNRAEGDPVFAYGDDPSTEALLAYWRRMVQVDLEASEGILTVKSFAFTPEDAQAITHAVLVESDALVNALSDKARSDAVSFAQRELGLVETRLRGLRQDMTNFRREHRMIDPSADVASQSGLLNALQGELAHSLVERDMLLSYTEVTDQRVVQADRRIDAIRKRIEAERNALQGGPQADGTTDETTGGTADGTGSALPEVIGAYEELKVDLEFANNAYTHALAGVAASQAEASRQSRYLVPHVQPTLADTALYPRKVLIAGMVGLFLFLGWSVLLLVYYNVRDNR